MKSPACSLFFSATHKPIGNSKLPASEILRPPLHLCLNPLNWVSGLLGAPLRRLTAARCYGMLRLEKPGLGRLEPCSATVHARNDY